MLLKTVESLEEGQATNILSFKDGSEWQVVELGGTAALRVSRSHVL